MADAWDVNAWMDNALASLQLPLSEEPMRQQVNDSDYITWQQTSVTNFYASGRVIRQSARVTVMLWAKDGSAWQQRRQNIIDALKASGASSAKPGPEAWMTDTNRRQVLVYLLLKRQV